MRTLCRVYQFHECPHAMVAVELCLFYFNKKAAFNLEHELQNGVLCFFRWWGGLSKLGF